MRFLNGEWRDAEVLESGDAAGPTKSERLWRGYGAAVLVLFLALAYIYVWSIQPGYGPDEPRHFAYVKRLAEKHELPLLVNGAEEDGAIALHPPLYYSVMVPVYLAARGAGDAGAIRVIKHLSPLLLLAALLLYGAMLRRIFPDRPFAQFTALAVGALMPEFLLEASVMNNDSMAVLMGAVFLWLLVRTWDEPPSSRWALLAGLVMALFVNAKATGWTVAPLWAAALFFRARKEPAARGAYIRDLFLAYGVLLLLGTPWYLRNYHLYGQAVPLPLEFQGHSMRPYNLRTGEPLMPLDVYTSGYIFNWGWRAVEGLFQSFWTQIDWVAEELRPAVYATLLALSLAAVAGWAIRLIPPVLRKRATPSRKAEGGETEPKPPYTPSLIAIPAAAFALIWLSTWGMATFFHIGFFQGGRYLMPAAIGAAALLAAGWEALLPGRVRLPAAVAVGVLFLGFNALCLNELITVLNPLYVR